MLNKIKITIFFVLIAIICKAQVPESLNYQAVVRNSGGSLIANKSVSMRITILKGSNSGSSVYTETHTGQTNSVGMINLKIGEGDDASSDFSDIDWGDASYYLKIELDEAGGTDYSLLGISQLVSVPYALYSKNALKSQNSANSDSALVAKSLDEEVLYFTDTDTLFAVKDRDGNIVFAVFPDGAKVYVNNTVKGNVGGFAVSGRTPNKASEENIFIITPDSTRVYIPQNVKGKVGGFAVSGRTPNKGLGENILLVNIDSTRIYIPDEPTKGNVGGFAVSGRTPNKGGVSEYFNISGKNSAGVDIVNPSEARMLWYPKSEAFLVGRVLIEHPDSVGLNSIATGFESKAIGDYSQAFGNQSIARRDYSTAIGKNAVAGGESSYAIGDMASTAPTSTNSYALGSNAYAKGSSSYAIGNGAISTGNGSFAFGAGGRDSSGVALAITTEAIAANSFAMGLGAKSQGINSFSIGTGTVTTLAGENAVAMGFGSVASGRFAIALGYKNVSSGASSMTWGGVRSGTSDYINTASGKASTAWGFKTTASGFNSTSWGSNSSATGWNGTAWGDYTIASGYCSTAWGKSSKALKDYNTAWLGGTALGYHTTAVGEGIVAHSYKSFVFGRSNDTIYSHSDINYYDGVSPWSYIGWYDDDPLFVVGNGWDHPSVGKRNALTILKDATTIIGWDMTVKSNASNPDTAFVRSVKIPRDNGFLFYVHGKAGGPLSWSVSSDLRLKQNINTIDGAMDKILKLRGVSFDWKDPDKKGRQLGFIAQEAIDVIPELVSGSEKTTYTMQYAPITAVLVEALKEEHKKVEELEKQLNELQDKLNEIIDKLNK